MSGAKKEGTVKDWIQATPTLRPRERREAEPTTAQHVCKPEVAANSSIREGEG